MFQPYENEKKPRIIGLVEVTEDRFRNLLPENLLTKTAAIIIAEYLFGPFLSRQESHDSALFVLDHVNKFRSSN